LNKKNEEFDIISHMWAVNGVSPSTALVYNIIDYNEGALQ